jgi:arginine decarboxylase
MITIILSKCLSICRNTIKKKPLYIGFFNTGAYQETIGGYGGLHHCLIPQPKHILINRDENGIIATEVFSEQQTSDDVLKI